MDLESLKLNWKHLLIEGFKSIFDELDQQLLSGTEAENQYFQIRARYSDLEKKIMSGTISHQDAEISRNQIRNSLLNFLVSLKETDLKGGVKSQETHMKATILSMENQLDDINEKMYKLIGIDTEEGESMLKNIIKDNINIEETLGLIHLVNCDRVEVKDSFWDAYDEKVDNEIPFQFYFFAGCPTQMPHSFSERMIYEIMNEELDNEEDAIHRIIDQDNGRIKIEELPEGRKLDRSQKEFKKYFSKRFSFQQDVSFDDYLNTGLPRLEYEYVTFVFETSEKKWRKDTAEYLEWMINSFNATHDDLPNFIFFFVIRMDGVHRENNINEKQKNIIDSIQNLVTKYQKTTFFKPFTPVLEKDIEEWLYEIGERSPTNKQIVMDAFVKGLYDKDGRKAKQYEDHQLLDMDDVQKLQKIIYDLYNDQYEE